MDSRPFISKTEQASVDKKLVGAYIDKIDASRLALIALNTKKSRSTILSDLINSFLSETGSLDDLIINTANKAFKPFDNLSKENKSIAKFEQLCSQTEADLKSHRIDIEIINKIILKLRSLNGQKNKKP